jgi:hypothetical protein
MGIFRALRELLILQMFLPRKEKEMTKRLAEVLKVADNPQASSTPRSSPCRIEPKTTFVLCSRACSFPSTGFSSSATEQ